MLACLLLAIAGCLSTDQPEAAQEGKDSQAGTQSDYPAGLGTHKFHGSVSAPGGWVAFRVNLGDGRTGPVPAATTVELRPVGVDDGEPHWIIYTDYFFLRNGLKPDPDSTFAGLITKQYYTLAEDVPPSRTLEYVLDEPPEAMLFLLISDMDLSVNVTLGLGSSPAQHPSRPMISGNYARIVPLGGRMIPLQESPANIYEESIRHPTSGLEGFTLGLHTPTAVWATGMIEYDFTFSGGKTVSVRPMPAALGFSFAEAMNTSKPVTHLARSHYFWDGAGYLMSTCQPAGTASLSLRYATPAISRDAFYFYIDGDPARSLGASTDCPPAV